MIHSFATIHSSQALLFIALFVRTCSGGTTSHIVDDQDSSAVSYTNSWNLVNSGEGCSSCSLRPDVTRFISDTYHDGFTQSSNDDDRQITVTFTGIALNVIFALPSGQSKGTALRFTLDGQDLPQNFVWDKRNLTNPDDSQTTFDYQQSVLSMGGLENREHTLMIGSLGMPDGFENQFLFDAVTYTQKTADPPAPHSTNPNIQSGIESIKTSASTSDGSTTSSSKPSTMTSGTSTGSSSSSSSNLGSTSSHSDQSGHVHTDIDGNTDSSPAISATTDPSSSTSTSFTANNAPPTSLHIAIIVAPAIVGGLLVLSIIVFLVRRSTARRSTSKARPWNMDEGGGAAGESLENMIETGAHDVNSGSTDILPALVDRKRPLPSSNNLQAPPSENDTNDNTQTGLSESPSEFLNSDMVLLDIRTPAEGGYVRNSSMQAAPSEIATSIQTTTELANMRHLMERVILRLSQTQPQEYADIVRPPELEPTVEEEDELPDYQTIPRRR